jgi:hypothetical protein
MNLDIKLPIGLMFLVLGIIITIHGIITMDNAELYARSLGFNVNLWTGILMIVFGGLMLGFSKRPKSKGPGNPDS